MKSIIIEGFDGCGKSTLARQLGQYFNMGVHTIGGRPKNDDIAFEMSTYQLGIAQHSRVIFDRVTCISRMCYEENIKNSHLLDLQEHMDFLANRCIVVWATVPKNMEMHEIKPYDDEAHLRYIDNNAARIKENYLQIMDSLNHIHYDFTEMTINELIEEINNVK